MFWGLVLEPGKKYTKIVENSFRLTTAVLDTTTKDDNIVRVFVEKENSKVLVGNLGVKASVLQIPLDLQFIVGDQISFFTAGGRASVHLSGYLSPDDDEMGLSFGGEEDSDDEAEEEEEDDDDDEVPELVGGGKRKLNGIESVPSKKTKITGVSTGAGTVTEPKSPLFKNFQNKLLAVQEESDSDDSDFNEEEEEDSDEEAEEEEEDSDEDGMMEEDEESDEEMEEEPKPVVKSPVSLKKKKNKGKEAATPIASPKSEKKSKIESAVLKTPKVQSPAKQAAINTPNSKKKKAKLEKLNTPQKPAEVVPTKTPTKSEKKKKKQQEALANGKTPEKAVESSPGSKTPNSKQKVQESNSASKPTKVVKAGGIVVEDTKVGTGAEVKNGKHVSMYYEGRLKSNNKMFDKTISGPAFKFRLGGGEVIKGWDVGVQGMKVGGKRRLTIPPHMGYGKNGALPDIPPNATLVFEVEVKGIN